MKSIQAIRFLVLLSMLMAGALQAGSTNLLPGVTFYDGTEKLTGKLVFLVKHDKPNSEFDMPANSITSASIYEFDLQTEKLNKLTDCPNGRFIPSADGDSFCVIYQLGRWHEGDDRNAFIYSQPLGLKRQVQLKSSPSTTVAIGGHIFFELGEIDHHELVDYDIAKDSLKQIALPDVGKWEIQDYDLIHAQPGQPNILHFHYIGIGKHLAEGKDYPDGIYSLDINTGSIRPFMIERLAVDRDDENYWFKTFDGNCISFSGSDEAPFNGFKLVSTDWNYVGSDEITSDDKAKNIKILHNFSKLGAAFAGAGAYHLIQTSPDRHYAWMKSGYTGTYYLTDVSTGKTRVLLKVDNALTPMVRWVQ